MKFIPKARKESPGDRECRSQDEERRNGGAGGVGVGLGDRRRVQERNLPQDEDVGWPGMDDFREHGLFLMYDVSIFMYVLLRAGALCVCTAHWV